MDSTLLRVSLGVVVIALIGVVVLYHVWMERRDRRQGRTGAGAPTGRTDGDSPDGAALRGSPAADNPAAPRKD
ncbi:MAG: hypothetical protein ACREM3_16660 [Candidatus Rokuibacteriota bacterium]